MAVAPTTLRGVVRGGVIVLENPASLPEGTEVTVTVPASEIPAELREEFAAWERASDEAWAMIDDLERRGKS
jgi:hypothetical protein